MVCLSPRSETQRGVREEAAAIQTQGQVKERDALPFPTPFKRPFFFFLGSLGLGDVEGVGRACGFPNSRQASLECGEGSVLVYASSPVNASRAHARRVLFPPGLLAQGVQSMHNIVFLCQQSPEYIPAQILSMDGLVHSCLSVFLCGTMHSTKGVLQFLLLLHGFPSSLLCRHHAGLPVSHTSSVFVWGHPLVTKGKLFHRVLTSLQGEFQLRHNKRVLPF